MATVALFIIFLFLEQCTGQIIDIGGVWEINCPQQCSCEVQKFQDLPLHRWAHPVRSIEAFAQDAIDSRFEVEHPLNDELLKVATCVIADNPEEILSKLPLDVQIFTILEAGNGNANIIFESTVFQRFTDLISLDIQGIDYNNPSRKDDDKNYGGVILSADALLPLGVTLLYLNLERIKLTSLSSTSKNKANLIIKPMINNETIEEEFMSLTNGQQKGHRLIFLSQQNNEESVDKEILPYDIYKQEVEGYRETISLLTGLGILTHLRIHDCALKDISWHMFDGLDNLLHLSLEMNNLKFIPEFCFYGTPNLKFLSLASNELLTLNSVDLAGLLMLEQLDLRGNNLTFLSELSFPPFPALRTADFRENPLDSVFPSTFEIMNTTVELYLGSDEAKLKLQKNSLLGLRQLEILHLHNVEILMLERFILQGMPILKKLKISGNISNIDFDAFIDLAGLRDLDLSFCHIKKISMDAFYGLENVQRIDLSNNDLDFIPPGLFTVQQQKQLKEIILSKNRLTTLPWDFFKNLRLPNRLSSIVNIRLDGNPWDCTCSMSNWNPHLVSKVKETAPRCFTPKRLQNWGIFQALRKGGLQCKASRRRYMRKASKFMNYISNNISN